MEPIGQARGMTRRRFLGAAAATLGSAAVTGCAGWSNTASNQSFTNFVAANPNATEITVWFWDDSLQAAVDAFHKAQNKIAVNFQKLSYDDTHQKLLTSLAAGSGAPDVCAIEIGLVGAFTNRGGMLDMVREFDANEFKDDMVEYKWLQGSSPSGQLYAMPWDIGPAALWYRADVLQKLKLPSEPEQVQARVKTWDDWFQLADDVKKASDGKVALFADAYNDVLWPLIEQQGHGWYNGNKLVIVEKGTKPLQVAKQVRERGLDGKTDWWGQDFSAGMKRGNIAGMAIASWMQSGLQRDQKETIGKWRIIRPPEGNFNWGGSFLGIPNTTQYPKEAWEFLKFTCCTTEGQNAIFKNFGIFPAFKPAWEDPLYRKGVDFYGGQVAYELYTQLAEDVPGNVVHRQDRRTNDLFGNEVTKVKTLDKDPVQATKDAEAAALRRIQGITA